LEALGSKEEEEGPVPKSLMVSPALSTIFPCLAGTAAACMTTRAWLEQLAFPKVSASWCLSKYRGYLGEMHPCSSRGIHVADALQKFAF
jgi:hypothetical protein